MAASRAVVDEQITRCLSDGVLRQLLDSVWPVDCQACGRPLGTGRPALVIDQFADVAQAGLYHPRCRASGWATTGVMRAPTAATLTWATVMIMLSPPPGETLSVPLMVVNPSLEGVLLQPSPLAGWMIHPGAKYTAAGLSRPSPHLQVRDPIGGAVARLVTPPARRGAGTVGGRVMLVVTVSAIEESVYLQDVDDDVAAQIVALDGVLLAVTHAVHPHEVSAPTDIEPVLAGDRSLMGWVQLGSVEGTATAGRRDARAVVEAAPDTTLLLHYSCHQVILGRVVAHTARQVSAAEAMAWAEPMIDLPGVRWHALHEGTYGAQGTRAGDQVAVLPSPDGWRLITVLSRAGGDVAETPTEARAWAVRVLGFVPDWQPGPAPAGVTTLYGTAI